VTGIGLYTPNYNSQIQYSIYINQTGPVFNPKSGTLALGPKTLTYAYPGYHTIFLMAPIPVTNSTWFSVVVRYFQNQMPAETQMDGYSSKAVYNGQSLVSCGGQSWDTFDHWAPGSYGNVAIKAFTKYQ
jgi:hypothetical protein